MQAFSGFFITVALAAVFVPSFAYATMEEAPGACPPKVANLQLSDQLARAGVRGAQIEFSLALLQELAPGLLKEKKNLVMSPYSISAAMTLLRAGATGKSAEELDRVLGYAASNGGLSFDDIMLGHQLLAGDIRDSNGGGSEIKTSNALWMGNQFSCNPTFRDRLKTYFSAPVEVVEFGTPAALAKINRQISTDTGGMIDPFLQQTSSSDSAILTNAIHFDGSWETPFDPTKTYSADFQCLDGSRKSVKLMRRKDHYQSVQSAKYTSVRLPLAGGKLHVDLVLPKGNLDRFIADLKGNELAEISRSLDGADQDSFVLELPRLELNFSMDLIPAFQNLGLKAPFQQKSGPDFSGMLSDDGGRSVNDLFVTLIKHVAVLSLDEKGVRAAASTAVGVSRSLPRTVRFDRPFLLVIGDKQNNPLFVTAIAEPE